MIKRAPPSLKDVSKPSLVGASTGLVAGLVAITPGAGYVSVGSVAKFSKKSILV